MKTTKLLFIVLLPLLVIIPPNLFSQGTEISITTVSEEAREAFLIGRRKKENIQLEAAEMLFNRAIELDPEFAMAYLYRGHPGDFEKAISMIDKVSEGERLTIKYFKAYEFYELNEARVNLKLLLEKYPSSKHVHLWAGLFYENILHNYQLALDHFYIASKLDETYAAPHNEIGYRHMRLGDNEKAEIAFKKYIDLAPECPNAFDSYANFLMKLKRYDESIQQYTEVYNLNPDKAVTIARIGQNYAFRGEYDEARSYYAKFYNNADNTGQKVTALSLSAASYIAEGEINEASKKLDEYIALGKANNSNVDVVLGTANMGQMYLETGDKEKGLQICKDAAELVKKLSLPEPTRIRYTFSSYGWLARAYAVNGMYKKADDQLSKAFKVVEKTNNPLYRNEYYFFKGCVDVEKGNYEEAISDLLMTNLDNPYNIYILAKAYSLSGEEESAQELIDVLGSWEDFGLDYIISKLKSEELESED